MFDLVTKWFSPEVVSAILTALTALVALLKALALFFGSMSMLVVALKKALDKIKPWVERTETSADDALLGLVATFLGMAAPKLEWLKDACEVVALNRFVDEQVVKVKGVR